MALAKSVNKLLLAANASKARLTVVTWYFMFAFRLIFAVQHRNGPGRGHYSSRTQINAEGQNGATIRVTS